MKIPNPFKARLPVRALAVGPGVITQNQAEKKYRKEIYDGTINTATTPHYDSLYEYMDMLEDSGFYIKNRDDN